METSMSAWVVIKTIRSYVNKETGGYKSQHAIGWWVWPLFSWYSNDEMNMIANMLKMVESEVEEFEDKEKVQ